MCYRFQVLCGEVLEASMEVRRGGNGSALCAAAARRWTRGARAFAAALTKKKYASTRSGRKGRSRLGSVGADAD